MAMYVQNTVIWDFLKFSNLDIRTFLTIWFMAEPVCSGQKQISKNETLITPHYFHIE